jgi:hypothetical protein
MNEHDFQEAIRLEVDADKSVREYARLLAKNSKHIAHWGNGNCGYIFEIVLKALQDEGLYKHQMPQAKKTKNRPVGGSLRTRVFERDMYRCKCCGTHENLSIDHIIPQVKGGTNEIDNLQTLCKTCNTRKGSGPGERGSYRKQLDTVVAQ